MGDAIRDVYLPPQIQLLQVFAWCLRVMASALLQMNVKNCTFTPLVAREEALL